MSGNPPPELLIPDWPLPPGVRALLTTRRGGTGRGPLAGFSLGEGCGDAPGAVRRNRRLLRKAAGLPAEPLWLRQVHGRQIIRAGDYRPGVEADGCLADRPGTVCVVLTADCLPLLLCDEAGREVAAVHAGWRGLASGIVPAAVRAFRAPPGRLLAWLGPAICQRHYEVEESLGQHFGSLL
ncbi:MAG: laccase domain-containing protein, partial [Gammaproteobacteria bacterium]